MFVKECIELRFFLTGCGQQSEDVNAEHLEVIFFVN